MRRGNLVLAAIVAIGATIAGCGSGGESITKGEYTRQANAICEKFRKQKDKAVDVAVKEAMADGGTLGFAAQVEIVSNVALPPIQKLIAELSEVNMPAGDEELLTSMVQSFEREIEAIAANPKEVIEGDLGFFREANDLAMQYGLDECAEV